MIYKAFDNDIVGAGTLKAFKRVGKTLKRGSDVRDRILEPEEFKALIEYSTGHLKGMLYMAYYTGMRKGEMLGLTWDKIDLASRMIKLEAEDTKDKEARNIPICDELYNYLTLLPNRIQESGKDNHVFQYKGQPIKGDIRDSLKKACKNAKIKYGRFEKGGFIFHDLRHTFNTNMRKAGVQESVIMAVTGHSTWEMFDRYNTIDEEDTRKAIKDLESFLPNVTHPVTHDGDLKNKEPK
jgi:integrase